MGCSSERQSIFLTIITMLLTARYSQCSAMVSMSYPTTSSNNNSTEQYIMYQNGQVQPSFKNQINRFACGNKNMFMYNLSSLSSSASIIFINMTSPYSVNISIINRIKNSNITVSSANPCTTFPNCTMNMTTICKKQDDFGLVTVDIIMNNATNISMYYNVICTTNSKISPFQYGLLIIVTVSVIQIIVCSHFQQANSLNNIGHYVNSISLTCYSLVIALGQTLILMKNVFPFTGWLVHYMALTVSVILGMMGLMLCFFQICYWIGLKFFHRKICIWKGNDRLIAVFGLIFCLSIIAGWFFSDTNLYVSDIIYTSIFVMIIKMVKFDSLKMGFITYIVTALLNVVFIFLSQHLLNIYYNTLIMYLFNNPLFILAPCLSFTPNQTCSWLFISCLAFPAMIYSYLVRFDKNLDTKIYRITFVCCLIGCTSVWIVICLFVPQTIPFDLINIPFVFGLLCFFAYRRGQLPTLWDGNIFDGQHKHKSNQQKQLEQVLKQQKANSFRSELFRIKISDLSSSSAAKTISLAQQNSLITVNLNNTQSPTNVRRTFS